MPLDVLIVYKDGSSETFYTALRMMRGEKENPFPQLKRTVLPDWPWAFPAYEWFIDQPLEEIEAIVIDPSQLMADIDRTNNIWSASD